MGLKNSFNKTNLDVENSDPSGFFNKDTTTSYSAFTTGTPTTTANPGPTQRFIQSYLPFNTYLSSNPVRGIGKLIATVAYTPLYVENSLLDANSPYSPYKQDKDPTAYPIYTTGTPTTKANPGPFNKFFQTYTPGNVYLNNTPIKGEGKLQFTTANSNLDVEDETPRGGIPYDPSQDPTVYPISTTGTPTVKANPAAPTHFDQKFIPSKTYLNFVKDLPDKSHLLNLRGKPTRENPGYGIFDITNLDIEKPGVDGGIPYSLEKDPTVYPITTHKKSSSGGFSVIQGTAASKFNQIFTPKSTYLDFIG